VGSGDDSVGEGSGDESVGVGEGDDAVGVDSGDSLRSGAGSDVSSDSLFLALSGLPCRFAA